MNGDSNFPYLFKLKQFKAFKLKNVRLQFRDDVSAASEWKKKVHIGG